MAWTCPKCARTLTKPNVWHQCIRKEPEELTEGKSPLVAQLLLDVHRYLSAFEGVSGSATKNCMVYVRNTTLIVMKPMKSALDIKLYLSEEDNEFPVYKVEHWGKRIGHHVRLFGEDDFDAAVKALLKRAWKESGSV
ncbi:MAG: hypothetical protein EOO16_04935 [Chitinophagaceae bacterium]|nr:MAG: hypothetical protein EOO16_04935 [Chitinophagaceae bacterium]